MSYGTTELPYTAARIKGIIKATGQITVKPAGLAGIQLDCNGATGDFTASITPANLTGNRRWILPNRDDTFAGLGAQTFTGAQILTDATASTSSTTGALVVTGGVGVGGRLNVGGVATFSGASSPVILNGAAATARSLRYASSGTARWDFSAIADTESGANAGSSFALSAYADNGAYIDDPLFISRAAGGSVLIRRPTSISGALEVSSTTLIKSNTTLTDGAAAAVGTLTNAPTAGNPTKWVLINDNGVIRKFPTWT